MALDKKKAQRYDRHMNNDAGFVTVLEAARQVEVSSTAVYDRVAADKLPHKTVFGKLVVSVAGLRAWEKERSK